MALIGSAFKQGKRTAFAALAVTAALGVAVPSAAQASELNVGAALSRASLQLTAQHTGYACPSDTCDAKHSIQAHGFQCPSDNCDLIVTIDAKSWDCPSGNCFAKRAVAAAAGGRAHRQLRP